MSDNDVLFTGFYDRRAHDGNDQVFMTPGYLTADEAIARISQRIRESEPGDLIHIDLIVHRADGA